MAGKVRWAKQFSRRTTKSGCGGFRRIADSANPGGQQADSSGRPEVRHCLCARSRSAGDVLWQTKVAAEMTLARRRQSSGAARRKGDHRGPNGIVLCCGITWVTVTGGTGEPANASGWPCGASRGENRSQAFEHARPPAPAMHLGSLESLLARTGASGSGGARHWHLRGSMDGHLRAYSTIDGKVRVGLRNGQGTTPPSTVSRRAAARWTRAELRS